MMEKLNSREHDIVYKPRTGDEMTKALHNKAVIHRYSDLCELAKKHGSTAMLAALFKRSPYHIILLQDPKNLSSGHWFSVSQNPQKKEIYFFSTYGGKPDREKLQWINEDDLIESGQEINIFNDGLKECQKHGWEIHYNDYPYQKKGDNTATCGIYTAAFLLSGKNPDEFEEQTKQLIRRKINPAVYYYDQYFL